MSLYFPPAAFSRFFHYRMDLSTSFYNTKDLFPVPILFFGDIIDIMSPGADKKAGKMRRLERSILQTQVLCLTCRTEGAHFLWKPGKTLHRRRKEWS